MVPVVSNTNETGNSSVADYVITHSMYGVYNDKLEN